jgi:hypothetical protein
VLMKHYLDTPDLSTLPGAYRGVIGRAMEKDPAKRFASVGELAKAVEEMFGGHRDAAVPPPLPIPPSPSPRPQAAPAGAAPLPDSMPDIPLPVATPVALPRAKARPVPPAPPPVPSGQTARDRITELAGGFVLVPLVAAACTAPWAAFQSAGQWSLLARVFLLATVLAWAVMIIGRLPKRSEQNPWGRRAIQLVVGLCLGALAFWLDGWALPTGTTNATSRDLVLFTNHRVGPETLSTGMRYLFYFGLTVALCRWWKATDRKRKERVRFFPLIAAGFWGAVFLFLWPSSDSSPMKLGVSVLVIAAVAAQAASPWVGPSVRARA